MTNEERLKEMSRKELAAVICGLIYTAGLGSCDMCKFRGYCKENHNGVYVWLGNEVR